MRYLKVLTAAALALNVSSLAQSAQAQSSQPKTGLATLPTPTGALLRWSLHQGGLPDGYRLTREGGGQTVSRDLPGMVDRATVVKNGWLTGDDYDVLKSLLQKSKLDPRQSLGLQLQILANPDWARALNLLTEDNGLNAGVTYTYRVQALRGGNAQQFASGSVTPGPTPPVANVGKLSATPSIGRAVLGWNPSGGLTMAYRVYRAQGSAAPQLLQPSPFFPNSDPKKPDQPMQFQDNDLTRKATYRYQVSAVDLFGREGAKSEALTVDLRLGEPLPQPVVRASGQAGGTAIRLDWDAANDSRVVGYTLLRGDTPNDMKPLKDVTGTTYTDAGIVAARKYFYALALHLIPGLKPGNVTAAGPATEGRAVNRTPPAALSGVTAVRGQDGTVAITWTASKEADLLGYLVVQSGTPGAALEDSAMLTGEPIQGTRLNIRLDGVAGGKFSYRVLAVNTSGVNSPLSAPATVTVPGGRALAATLTKAQGRDSSIDLGWSYPDGDDGKAQVPAKVEVFRQNPSGELALIARLPGAQTTFSDTHVIPLLDYAYTVAMLGADGKRSEASNILGARALYQPSVGAVSGLSVRLDGAAAQLSWQAAPDAASYQVYRVKEGAPLLLATVTALGYRDAQASAGVTYRVVARALDGTTGRAAEATLGK